MNREKALNTIKYLRGLYGGQINVRLNNRAQAFLFTTEKDAEKLIKLAIAQNLKDIWFYL